MSVPVLSLRAMFSCLPMEVGLSLLLLCVAILGVVWMDVGLGLCWQITACPVK